MKKIIKREITNEDGDAYGIVGDITRLGAYRAIKQDMRGWGIAGDVDFTPDDLEVSYYWETTYCPHDGEHEDWTWWKCPGSGDKVKPLGKGWILKI